MRDEPKGELARYAFGFSDKKPGWTFWLIMAAMVAYILWNAISISPADARSWCHRSWGWGWNKASPSGDTRCGTHVLRAYTARAMPAKPETVTLEIIAIPPALRGAASMPTALPTSTDQNQQLREEALRYCLQLAEEHKTNPDVQVCR